ncbi:carboxylate--amine ligase, partial [Microbacterium sp. HMWF026]
GIAVPRGELDAEARQWEASIDAAAADDEEMSDYIRQLEQTRDTWDSPEASGDAIAQEFERYLRRGGDGPAKPGRDDPPRR